MSHYIGMSRCFRFAGYYKMIINLSGKFVHVAEVTEAISHHEPEGHFLDLYMLFVFSAHIACSGSIVTDEQFIPSLVNR